MAEKNVVAGMGRGVSRETYLLNIQTLTIMIKQFIYVVEETFYYNYKNVDYQNCHHAGENHYFSNIKGAESYVNTIINEPLDWEQCDEGLFESAYEQWKLILDDKRYYITIYMMELLH